MRLGRIIVGVATAESLDPVLAPALELGRAPGAELHVVHTLAESGALRGEAEARRNTTRLLEDQLVALGAPADTRLHVIQGSAHRTLASEGKRLEADLIVTGPSRRGALACAVLGSTAQQLLRSTEIPVLILRRPLPRRALRVLLTTDLSILSEQVHLLGAAYGRALSRSAEPSLMSLCVRAQRLGPPDLSDRTEETDLDAEFARFVATCTPPGARVERRVRSGVPAAEILAEANDWAADLVVLGTHARRGAAWLLLGSVAEAVVRGATRNVLVVPAGSVRHRGTAPLAARDARQYPAGLA